MSSLPCLIFGHRFSGDTATGERGQRTCERCGMVRGAPAARAEPGPEREQLKVMAEAAREVSRRIMRNVAGGRDG